MVVAQPQEPLYMTEIEYLAFEEQSEIKHEFVDGKVYAMAGAGINHNIINGNVQTTLNTQVSENCVVVSSDMRLKVDSKKYLIATLIRWSSVVTLN
ncbi:MAG: Uma2 family endonuclease [Chloroflexota bacterium]